MKAKLIKTNKKDLFKLELYTKNKCNQYNFYTNIFFTNKIQIKDYLNKHNVEIISY